MLNPEDLEGSSHISSRQAYQLPEASNYNLEHSQFGHWSVGQKLSMNFTDMTHKYNH
jgi:hypothetical protein